jgi:hypothetical protein
VDVSSSASDSWGVDLSAGYRNAALASSSAYKNVVKTWYQTTTELFISRAGATYSLYHEYLSPQAALQAHPEVARAIAALPKGSDSDEDLAKYMNFF